MPNVKWHINGKQPEALPLQNITPGNKHFVLFSDSFSQEFQKEGQDPPAFSISGGCFCLVVGGH